MAVFLTARAVKDYIINLTALLHRFGNKCEIDEKQFTKLTKDNEIDRNKIVCAFLKDNKDQAIQGLNPELWDKLRSDGKPRPSANLNELRNFFVHRFRPMWWHRGNNDEYGFPLSFINSVNGDKDALPKEMWSAITNPEAWEGDFNTLPETEFKSGISLLKEMHHIGATFTNGLYEWIAKTQDVA